MISEGTAGDTKEEKFRTESRVMIMSKDASDEHLEENSSEEKRSREKQGHVKIEENPGFSPTTHREFSP